jgi:DNA polymerase III delta prime subunit
MDQGPLTPSLTQARIEKYRPATLDDVSGHQDILATINKFVDSNRLPHLLLYGPPGTGKTSTILALARRIYGTANMRQMVLELNASDDRGIDVVREQIKTFASTKQIFSMGGASAKSSIAGFKLIILDEADAMTNTAQMALRRIMEKYTVNTRFCIIANYSHKLSPALLSRCTRFRFSPLKEGDIRVLVEKVVEEENVQIRGEAVDALVKLSKGDMRRALNVLQACHASSKLIFFGGGGLLDVCVLIVYCRHAASTKGCAQDPGERNQARDDHYGDDIQLHCGTAAGRCQGDCGDAVEHVGRDELFEYDKRPQGHEGTGTGRHHHGFVRGAG